MQKEKTKNRIGQTIVAVALLLCFGSILSGCGDNCEVKNSYTYYEPVYTPLSEIRSSVSTLPAHDLEQTGKIYFKDGYLFINEPNEGVHVIDNHDPANPENIAFINIPGSFDIAVRGNILFSDSYIDLVAIDISDIQNAREVGRIENLFPGYNSYGFYADTEMGIVTDWEAVDKIEEYESDCNANYNWGMFYERGIAVDQLANFDVSAALAPTNPGMAGSMARFAVVGDYLYAVDQSDLYPVNVSNSSDLEAEEKVVINWGIETIFPNNNHLFIGAQNGMYIMDISNPAQPAWVSSYEHVTSCDPVVVDGDYAYVTLRSGTECQGFTNQLEVIDISNISSPELLYTYNMHNPHGLGKDGDVLFICDGDDGLKVFDASDIGEIGNRLVAHYKDIKTFDIIPFNNIAMMIGEDGLYQYDYSDINHIVFLSHLQVSGNVE
ncbi:hypothetical protein GCM10009122_50090 [Fulvivirga kasyanovii]|uniref:LVIVD repeat-containing protein n=1 Tax=Fulvivirga kasyanovii TaxID=396812 RepID=A0ABW9RQI3_9BACT|nr:hypothetical protein [Fulvivirga kasyanovii]MTI26196.1 hypothetical protein [Fulvivirga kasyanovii]